MERFPAWAHAASGLVLVLGALIAAHVVPMLALLPVLVVSSIGRRFSSAAVHLEVLGDGGRGSRALMLGERRVPSDQILDVWRDASAEGTGEARVIVATGATRGADLAICYFANAVQAQRFADAFTPRSGSAGNPACVAGHRPRPVDALSSLRFVAIAGAFFGTGSWFGAFALAYFGLGALALIRAKQIIAKRDGFEIHSFAGSRSHGYTDVANVDVDVGAVTMKDGTEIVIARGAIRDTALAAPVWLDQARSRVLECIAKRAAGRASRDSSTPED